MGDAVTSGRSTLETPVSTSPAPPVGAAGPLDEQEIRAFLAVATIDLADGMTPDQWEQDAVWLWEDPHAVSRDRRVLGPARRRLRRRQAADERLVAREAAARGETAEQWWGRNLPDLMALGAANGVRV